MASRAMLGLGAHGGRGIERQRRLCDRVLDCAPDAHTGGGQCVTSAHRGDAERRDVAAVSGCDRSHRGGGVQLLVSSNDNYRKGHTVEALPIEKTTKILKKYGAIK
jgi:hypothetical protein